MCVVRADWLNGSALMWLRIVPATECANVYVLFSGRAWIRKSNQYNDALARNWIGGDGWTCYFPCLAFDIGTENVWCRTACRLNSYVYNSVYVGLRESSPAVNSVSMYHFETFTLNACKWLWYGWLLPYESGLANRGISWTILYEMMGCWMPMVIRSYWMLWFAPISSAKCK